MKPLIYSTMIGLLGLSSTNAAIMVSGDFDVVGGASVQFTNNITFTVTSTNTVNTVVFDDWVVDDGNQSSVLTSALSYQINAGPVLATTGTFIYDNLNNSIGSLTPNDGYFYFDNIPVLLNDSITFFAGTSLNTTTNTFMNPALNGLNFTGNAFLTNGAGVALSGLTSVNGAAVIPEPSTYIALAGFAGLGLFLWRRRSQSTKAK